jgi:glycosyltransferase involved in cell wall biosynthesis
LPLEQLPFSDRPGHYLAFVGRITPEKGVADAIELARRTGLPLRMAAKVYDPHEVEHFRDVVQPAIDDGTVEFLGELGQNARDALYTGALATVMLGAWPEPFGLVAIESMATGTPIIARRAGGLMETVDHGVTGFLVDDLTEAQLAVRNVPRLRRHAVRQRVIERFLPARMAAEYETAYRKLLASRAAVRAGSTVDPPTPLDPAVLTATPALSRPRARGRARSSGMLTALPVGEPVPEGDGADLSDGSISSVSGSASAR